MHLFNIKITKYSREGALTNEVINKTADTPHQAKIICDEWDKIKYETIDDQGKVVVGNKMYKVELQLLCYKTCTDKNAFFAQFEA